MKPNEAEAKDLKEEQIHSEQAKISFVEGLIVLMLAGTADFAEFVGGLFNIVPVVGTIVWFITFVFGLAVSFALILWTLLRGVHGRFFVKRVVINGAGVLADAFFGGWLPIRFVVLAIVIWLNNHFEGKNIKRIAALMGV